MKSKLTLLLLALLAAAGAHAQDDTRVRVSLASDYDLDSASYIYLTTKGQLGKVLNGPVQRSAKACSSGSSTTVTACTANDQPFLALAVGDEVYFVISGVVEGRRIDTWTDADNIVVDSNIDLTDGYSTNFRKAAAGTGATDGWIPTAGFSEIAFEWQIEQSDGGSVDVRVEGQNLTPSSSTEQLFTKNYTAYGCPASSCDAFRLSGPLPDQVRIGFKINTDSSDAGGALEKISVQFIGTK